MDDFGDGGGQGGRGESEGLANGSSFLCLKSKVILSSVALVHPEGVGIRLGIFAAGGYADNHARKKFL